VAERLATATTPLPHPAVRPKRRPRP